MEIIKWQEKEIKQNPHGVDVRPIYNKENAQAMHLTLKPGEGLKPHLTPVNVFFYVLEGKPTILIGDEEKEIEKDILVESPADIVHCISNSTNKIARILVVKAPRPVKASRVL